MKKKLEKISICLLLFPLTYAIIHAYSLGITGSETPAHGSSTSTTLDPFIGGLRELHACFTLLWADPLFLKWK
jgi:hypothetical protein